MPRKKSKAVPEGNGLIPQDACVMSGGTTLVESRQVMSEALDKAFHKYFGQKLENSEEMRATDQRPADAEHDARQTTSRHGDRRKTRYQDSQVYGRRCSRSRKTGDNSSAQVDPDPRCLISFGDDSAEPLPLPCRDDVLVDKGVAAPKPCISAVEMHTLTATGGLLPAGTASSATRTNSHQPPLWFCTTEEIDLRTSIQYATTYSSF